MKKGEAPSDEINPVSIRSANAEIQIVEEGLGGNSTALLTESRKTRVHARSSVMLCSACPNGGPRQPLPP